MQNIKFESYKDYIIFLYVHIAFADGSIQDEEKELIEKKLSRYFDSKDEIDEKLEAMLLDYQSNTEPIDSIIKRTVKKYSNIEFFKKYRIFKDLYEIIECDGVIHSTETQALKKLESIIDYEMRV